MTPGPACSRPFEFHEMLQEPLEHAVGAVVAVADRIGEQPVVCVEQAVVNSNSRPEAEDLCQIGLSMAQSGIEPSADLWNRMQAIKTGLGVPW